MMNSDSGLCLRNCKLATCGDGKTRTGVEECDDGNGLVNNAGILRDGLLVKKDRTTGEVTKLSKGASATARVRRATGGDEQRRADPGAAVAAAATAAAVHSGWAARGVLYNEGAAR
jgi:cysteine-rich repeat protein